MNSNSSTDCPWCHSPTREVVSGKILFHECPACGFVFKDARHHLDPETEKGRYELHSPVAGDGYRTTMASFVENAVLPYVKEGTALDFGCGRIGLLGNLLAEKGFLVAEYDPYFRPDGQLLNQTYDLITAVEVVEHFSDPVSEFSKLNRLLKKGGILAIVTQFVIPKWTTWWYIRDITHQSFYAESSFQEIARKNGWAIRFSDHQNLLVFEKR